MGEVIREITGWEGNLLSGARAFWFGELVGDANSKVRKPLRRCSSSELRDGPHGWNARAYDDDEGYPARRRIRELKSLLSSTGRIHQIAQVLQEQAALQEPIRVKLNVNNRSSGPTHREDGVVIQNECPFTLWVKEVKWFTWVRGTRPDVRWSADQPEAVIRPFENASFLHRGGPDDVVMRVAVEVVDQRNRRKKEIENNPDGYALWRSLYGTEFPS
ncbi:MAG: hypothetical protein HY652_11140 [Acidobacteria bacterium]|nr:hypothetical protein [Acidobacteriota bacterium]